MFHCSDMLFKLMLSCLVWYKEGQSTERYSRSSLPVASVDIRCQKCVRGRVSIMFCLFWMKDNFAKPTRVMCSLNWLQHTKGQTWSYDRVEVSNISSVSAEQYRSDWPKRNWTNKILESAFIYTKMTHWLILMSSPGISREGTKQYITAHSQQEFH